MSKSSTAPGLSQSRQRELRLFLEKNNLPLKNLDLLDIAFTHSSYANELVCGSPDNERLEFLGDSVLSLAVSSFLFLHSKDDEGRLSKIKAYSVSEDSLAKVALNLELDSLLLLGRGEELSGGRKKQAILADCVEAVLAAVYLECGFDTASEFIIRNLSDTLSHAHSDYKTALQEYVQKKYKTVPMYTLVKKDGPEHFSSFWVTVSVNGETYGPEMGHSKKEAEHNVAQKVCSILGIS